MTRPLVTVLMPVHNGEAFVSEAVESILRQSIGDIEFLIIDDGSTDATYLILKQYTDFRIVLVDQGHQGLIATLNHGLKLAQGDFVAIMHADDVAHPKRIQKQVAFLGTHPDVGIVGSAYEVINSSGQRLYCVYMPEDDLAVRWVCMLSSPFGHPTVMMRRELLQNSALKYETKFDIVEDYDLWSRLLGVTEGANLRSPLLRYRTHPESRTGQFRIAQLAQQDQIALSCIHQFLPGFSIDVNQVSGLRGLFVGGGEFIPDLANRKIALGHLYLDLLEAYLSERDKDRSCEVLRRKVVLDVANLILTPPFLEGRESILKRLSIIETALPLLIMWNSVKKNINLIDRLNRWTSRYQYGS
jgi:glycosyltransferase involved in cell wall biosynthesis